MKYILGLIFICQTLVATSQDSLAYSSIKEYPVLWQQMSAEYRALCYQAFNLATLRLDQALPTATKARPLAIITDLDETILDNSYLAAYRILNDKEIPYGIWKGWLDAPDLPTVPGGVDFLQYAASKGVTIFYISNRNIKGMSVTLSTLQKLNLPNADTEHILLTTDDPSKESRRQTVYGSYKVVLLLGDNLNDFLQVFEDKNIADRFAETDSVRNDWGKKFIVLPNSAYGEWENALYNYDPDLTPAQKEAIRRELVKKIK